MSRDIKKKIALMMWPFIVVFLLLSLVAALHWYLTLDTADFSLKDFSLKPLLAAMAFQILALAVTVLAWHINLFFHRVRTITALQSVVMVGINAIGKYTPGKVWGAVARGAALLKIAPNPKVVVMATLSEQLALIHSGTVFLGLTYLYRNGFHGLLIAGVILSFLSLWCVTRSEKMMIFLVRFLRRTSSKEANIFDSGFRESYLLVFAMLSLMWVLVSLVLYFCLLAYTPQLMPDAVEIFTVTLLSYMGGFIAFFSIAGLGVREGIMVAMLSSYVGVSGAFYISLVHRLITAFFDVLLAVIALILMGRAFKINKEE